SSPASWWPRRVSTTSRSPGGSPSGTGGRWSATGRWPRPRSTWPASTWSSARPSGRSRSPPGRRTPSGARCWYVRCSTWRRTGCDRPAAGRAAAARAGAAGARRAGPAHRRLRDLRGRGAGGAARGGHAVAGRGGAREPDRLAGHGRVPAADGAVAERDGAPAPGAGGVRVRGRARAGDRGGRHADPADAVLPPGADAGFAGRADAARGRRVDHGRDRPGAARAGADRRAADQPAKQRIRAAGGTFAPPADDERADRLAAVLHVLYLIFTEGHTASSGSSLQRVELSAEALRLA